jgi:hypothetical protein
VTRLAARLPRFLSSDGVSLRGLRSPAVVLVLGWGCLPLLTKIVSGLVGAVAMFAQVNARFPLIEFEREAPDVKEVLVSLLPRSDIVQRAYNAKEQVVGSRFHLHFRAYAETD